MLKFNDLLSKTKSPSIPLASLTTLTDSITKRERAALTPDELLALARLRTFPEFQLMKKILIENYLILSAEVPLLPPSVSIHQLAMLKAFFKLIELLTSYTENAVTEIQNSFFDNNSDVTQ